MKMERAHADHTLLRSSPRRLLSQTMVGGNQRWCYLIEVDRLGKWNTGWVVTNDVLQGGSSHVNLIVALWGIWRQKVRVTRQYVEWRHMSVWNTKVIFFLPTSSNTLNTTASSFLHWPRLLAWCNELRHFQETFVSSKIIRHMGNGDKFTCNRYKSKLLSSFVFVVAGEKFSRGVF